MFKNNQIKIIEALSQIEKEVPVNDWKYKSVQVWPFVRVMLGHNLFIVEDFEENNQISNTRAYHKKAIIVLKVIFKIIKCFFSDFKKNDFSNKEIDVLYVVNSSTSFFKVDKKWYNPYSDSFYPYVERRGFKQKVLELASDFQLRTPRFRKSNFAQISFFLMQLKAIILAKVNSRKNVIDYQGLITINNILSSNFEKYKHFDVSFFNTKLILFEEYRKYFRRKLKKWKPKVMVCQGYYSPEIMALIAVCHELNIKTIDIQHGVQGEFHQAYSNWSKVPETGYALFPDLFWTWGENEKRNIDTWLKESKRHYSIVGGNPCAFVLDKMGKDVMSIFSSQIESVISKTGAKINIIFTVQAFFELPTFFLDTVTNTPHWNWWIRVHPQYTETSQTIIKKFKELGCNNVLIKEAGEYPLIALLKFMDVHITEFSSSVLESYSVGVPSVVINEKGKNLFSDLISAGFVKTASTEKELIIAIYNLLKNNNLRLQNNIKQFENAITTEINGFISNNSKNVSC